MTNCKILSQVQVEQVIIVVTLPHLRTTYCEWLDKMAGNNLYDSVQCIAKRCLDRLVFHFSDYVLHFEFFGFCHLCLCLIFDLFTLRV